MQVPMMAQRLSWLKPVELNFSQTRMELLIFIAGWLTKPA